MNTTKALWCRAFQLGFRIAMPVLPYTEPRILSSVEQIGAVLRKKKKAKVLIVTDRGVVKAGLCDSLTDSLDKNNISYAIYDSTIPNPTINNIEEAREMYIQNNCMAVIGFGGGSAMDCAKIVCARVACPKKKVSSMKGLLKIHRPLPLLIAVPTTAGTGSEVTLAAVITDQNTKHKYPINDFCLIPRYCALDCKLTVGLPAHMTATTGMDALTHAVEAYIGRSTTKYTREAALTAIRLIYENIYTAYTDGSNIVARENMQKAAYLAGVAFTRSYVGYVHGIAHSLGGRYSTPHGLANAVILPYVLKEYGDKAQKKLADIARMLCLPADSDELGAKSFIDWVIQINEKMGIPRSIGDIEDKDIPELAKKAEKESNPLYPVPKLMDAKELEKIYIQVKKGEL